MYMYIVHVHTIDIIFVVRSFLLGLGKRVFQRGEGGTPLKLTAQEAQQIQRENSCSQYYSDQNQKH